MWRVCGIAPIVARGFGIENVFVEPKYSIQSQTSALPLIF